MKFVFIKDIHLSHRGPVSRIDDWTEAIFAKLTQVAAVAVKVQARAVLIGGDIFHHKTRIAYGVVFRFMDWCWKLKHYHGIDVVAIPGNHDLVFDRLDSVPTQPIGLLFRSGLVIDATSIGEGREHGVYSIPGEPTVDIYGVPYPLAKDWAQWQQLAGGDVEPANRAIVLAHCFASPSGGTCFNEPCMAYGQLAALPFDVFCFGHDHADNGVTQVNGKVFVNIGALSRGSISKEDVTRDVKLAVIDVPVEGPATVQLVRLKIAPASEVFDLTLKAKKDREFEQIQEFVGTLSSDLLAQTGNVSFKDRVTGMDLPDAVRTRVMGYIEAAEAQV